MDSLTLEIDFTGITAAGGGLTHLDPGLHTANIDSFRHFTDNGSVLYAYMVTDSIRHRERFNLGSSAAKSFLMAFLASAGVPENKMSGKSAVPFDKLVGRTVYFNYVPPQIDANGRRIQGTYPKYSFYTKSRYEKMAKLSNEAAAPKNNGSAGAPVMSSDSNAKSGEFDFLLNG